MASWFIPALKAILPHVGDIVSAAKPIFTKARGDSNATPSLLVQQIAELQATAASNDDHIKELAAQLQSVVAAMEQSAAATEMRWKKAIALSLTALAVSLSATGIALFALLSH